MRDFSLVDTGNLSCLKIRARRSKLISKDGVLNWGIWISSVVLRAVGGRSNGAIETVDT